MYKRQAQYSHTDSVVAELFPESHSVTYFAQIEDVFAAISEGRFTDGVVPFENSTHGSVLATLEALFRYPDVNIIDSFTKTIEQHLLGLPETNLKNISAVFSHPQALAQSRDWLAANIPKVQKVSARSTALAAERLLSRQNLAQAVIGSEALATGLGLKVLARDLAPAGNKTRFIRLSKAAVPLESKYLSLVFWFGEDQAGSLASVLEFLASNDINLTKLDSRRSLEVAGNYLFFIDAQVSLLDFEAHAQKFATLVEGYRILGSFDR